MISDVELERGSAWTTGEDERPEATTPDGWRLARYRYRGRGRPCGHGLAGSRWIFDVHAQCSIARARAGRGHDGWLVDRRGRGDGWPAGGPDDERQWSFDDVVERDRLAGLAAPTRLYPLLDAFLGEG